MADRSALMKKIRMYDFVITEMVLFLDTHPNSPEGLAHFRKYQALREQAMNDYTANFGPIQPTQTHADTHWTWIDDPWPWEREANQ